MAVGWFWYLGTLVPVIGLLQIGMQARADRYTYIPSVGLCIVLAWAVAEWIERSPVLRPVVSAIAGMVADLILSGTDRVPDGFRLA